MIIDSFTGEYHFLSNFYPCQITIEIQDEKLTFSSAEHAYQASKCVSMDEILLFTASNLTAGQAKRFGRKVKIRTDWNSIKLSVMTDIVWQKFSDKNPNLVDKLLDTGHATLVEGNWWGDTFWGICDDIGSNHLGQILMNRRNQIRLDTLLFGDYK